MPEFFDTEDVTRLPAGMYAANPFVVDTLLRARPRGTLVVGNDGCVYQSISDPPIPGYVKIGAGAAAAIQAKPFQFTSISPLIVGPVTPGSYIYGAKLQIQITFDDPATTLTLGTTSNPVSIFTAGDINPQKAGTYICEEPILVTVNEDIILTINAAASVQGLGVVFVDVRQP